MTTCIGFVEVTLPRAVHNVASWFFLEILIVFTWRGHVLSVMVNCLLVATDLSGSESDQLALQLEIMWRVFCWLTVNHGRKGWWRTFVVYLAETKVEVRFLLFKIKYEKPLILNSHEKQDSYSQS